MFNDWQEHSRAQNSGTTGALHRGVATAFIVNDGGVHWLFVNNKTSS